MVGSKSGRYTLKPAEELCIPILKVTEHVNDLFAAAVDYQNYRLLKKSSLFEN